MWMWPKQLTWSWRETSRAFWMLLVRWSCLLLLAFCSDVWVIFRVGLWDKYCNASTDVKVQSKLVAGLDKVFMEHNRCSMLKFSEVCSTFSPLFATCFQQNYGKNEVLQCACLFWCAIWSLHGNEDSRSTHFCDLLIINCEIRWSGIILIWIEYFGCSCSKFIFEETCSKMNMLRL